MSLAINDIEKIIRLSEKERIDIELKSFRKLIPFDDVSKKDIAAEIVAFANRNGGKIIFGVNDNGSFESTTGINIDIDTAKSNLHNLCFDNISPVVECNTQVIEDTQGIFLIVYVPKRRGMPHACIEKRSGHNIKARTYYIRTSHGKKLVSDGQLQWLFLNQGEPAYSFDFRIAFEFNKNFEMIGDTVPWGNYEIGGFRELLSPVDKTEIINDSNKFNAFLNGAMPYLILLSLSNYFKESWHIGIAEGFDRLSSGPLITKSPVPSHSVYVHEIPVAGTSFLHGLSWDFPQILKELFINKISTPPDTSIQINYQNQSPASSIVLSNPNFKIEILTGMLSGGAGLHPKSILHDLLFQRYHVKEQQESLFNFIHYDAAGHLIAQINYPEYDMSEFDAYLGYYNNLMKLLDYNWNYDSRQKEQPPKEMVIMDDKLNEILELLRNKSVIK